ncbi:unnamed protein product [Phytophthora fragariaefolia]|uniref:Unnamed protein product n=1 Tax=Phytophthora fragariaefolia TaxID=1490495 RepID=A0A9W6Y323_9STRA|nr:unnamed protein product [Phytophthora fragariaefolia]
MPSPPSSVIVLDDSSDEDATTAASGRRSAPLVVGSSDESDSGRPSQPKKPRVASPKFSFTAAPTARKGLNYGSVSSDEEPSDSQDHASDVSDPPVPRGKKKKAPQKRRKGSAGQSSATTDSDDYTHEEGTQLNFAESDGRMFSDVMSFSELQAQQRELERLQAKAHRASKSVPHKTARRATTAGAKRKASDAGSTTLSSPHSGNKSSVMKKTTSPSPFDFDFPGSDEESSSLSSSSSIQDNRTTLSSSRAKPMSLKDVVAQERELARLRNETAKKANKVAPPKKKSALKQAASNPSIWKTSTSKSATTNPAIPKSSFSLAGDQKDDKFIDATEWSSSHSGGGDDDDIDEYKPKSSSLPERMVADSFSESEDERISDVEYSPVDTKNIAKASAHHRSQHTSEQYGKIKNAANGKKATGPKNSSKSKVKKNNNKAGPSSAKSETHNSLPAQASAFTDKLTRPRNSRDTVMHSTVWRNVCFDSAPPNLLSLDSTVSLPFNSECDRPLLAYGALRNSLFASLPYLRINTPYHCFTQIKTAT